MIRPAVVARRSVMYLVLIAALAFAVAPLLYAFFAAFKPIDEILSSGAQLLPQTWTLENFVHVWNIGSFGRYFGNSIFVTAGAVLIDLASSSMLGYLLARHLLPAGRTLSVVMASVLFLGVGTVTLYPRFVIADWFGVSNLIGVILVELSSMTVIHTFLIRGFVQSLPREIEDAARVDGAGLWRTYWRVVFPLMRPILATTVVLGFQAAWNAFQTPYVFTLSEPDQRTLVVAVYALRSTAEGTQAYDLMLAGAVIIIVPVAIMFFLLQRYFIRGLTEGSLKG